MKQKPIGLLTILLLSSFMPAVDGGDDIQVKELEDTRVKIENTLIRKANTEKYKKITSIMGTIRYIETGSIEGRELKGGSGENGAYQMMPSTRKGLVKMFFGKDSIEYERMLKHTRNNDDLIVYKVIEYYLDKGYTVEQIASIWNCGKPSYEGRIGVNKYGVAYDVPRYVNNFMKKHKEVVKTYLLNA